MSWHKIHLPYCVRVTSWINRWNTKRLNEYRYHDIIMIMKEMDLDVEELKVQNWINLHLEELLNV